MKTLINLLILSVTLTLTLPVHAENPVTKTVTAQGEGLAATQCCVPESIASTITTSACRDKP